MNAQPPSLSNDDRVRLDEAIVAICSVGALRGVSGDLGVRIASEIVGQQLQTGGKRLRGLLPIALVRGEGGDVSGAVVWGAAIEAIHNGTLVHDDIQDRDTLRRGEPTLWTQTGVAQAINAGDVLLVAPIAAIAAERRWDAALGRELAALLAGALLETIRGQVADVALRDASGATREELSAIACAKTSPLFACALQGAVLLTGGEDSRLEAARLCGHRLGLAFQVRDDVLDAHGTKGRGAAGSDLREGKPTWPLLAACTDAPPAQLDALRVLLRSAANGVAPSDEDVARWVEWMHVRGGVKLAEQALEATLDEARGHAKTAFPRAFGAIEGLCDRLQLLDG